jgi:hypothetical protein
VVDRESGVIASLKEDVKRRRRVHYRTSSELPLTTLQKCLLDHATALTAAFGRAAQVQEAFLAGLAVVLLLIPVNRALAARIEAASGRMMGFKDARIRRTHELLRGIRQIKAAAWERCFVARVGSPVLCLSTAHACSACAHLHTLPPRVCGVCASALTRTLSGALETETYAQKAVEFMSSIHAGASPVNECALGLGLGIT